MMSLKWGHETSKWQQILQTGSTTKITVLATLLSTLILYLILKSFWARQVFRPINSKSNSLTRFHKAEAKFARAHGCKDPIPLQGKWPLGLDLIVEAFGHARAQQILQFFLIIIDRTGPTFEQNLLGAKGIDTVDPTNIETVLSTKFQGT